MSDELTKIREAREALTAYRESLKAMSNDELIALVKTEREAGRYQRAMIGWDELERRTAPDDDPVMDLIEEILS